MQQLFHYSYCLLYGKNLIFKCPIMSTECDQYLNKYGEGEKSWRINTEHITSERIIIHIVCYKVKI